MKNFTKSDAGGAFEGEAIGSGANAREGDGAEVVFFSQSKAVAVAVGEQVVFVVVSAMPDRADGVDDIPRGQIIAGCYLGFAGVASAQCFTMVIKSPARSRMNGRIDPATAEQGRICGIDDGVDRQCRDVALNNFDLFHTVSSPPNF